MNEIWWERYADVDARRVLRECSRTRVLWAKMVPDCPKPVEVLVWFDDG